MAVDFRRGAVRQALSDVGDWNRGVLVSLLALPIVTAILFQVFALPKRATVLDWIKAVVLPPAAVALALVLGGLILATKRQRDAAIARVDEVEGEMARRDRVDFSCRMQVEDLDFGIVVNDRPYDSNTVIWLHVMNDGPTSDFVARIPRTSLDDGRYTVPHPAWEHTDDARWQIAGRGGEARLRLANVAANPPMFWFYTVEAGRRQAGTQFGWPQSGRIEFDLEIVNVGGDDQVLRKRGVIEVNPRELRVGMADVSSAARGEG